jgi:hypothetical protein
MNQKRRLATKDFAREVAFKADSYGGGPLVQSILNYLKKNGEEMVEMEMDNIKNAFDAGVFIGMNTTKFPAVPASVFLKDMYELD